MKTFYVNDWQFLRSDEKLAWQKDFDDSLWQEVTVPHDWSVTLPFEKNHSSGTGYLAGGIGWYRAHVPISKLGHLANKIIKIHFEGVYKNARVWVNGYHLGSRASGYASFYFNLTEILKYAPDDDLVISVRVERTDLADSRWYNGTGINRKVSIEIHDEIYIDDYGTTFTTPVVSKSKSELCIEHKLMNTSEEEVDVTVVNRLESLQRNSTYTIKKEVALTESSTQIIEIKDQLSNPELWSPEQPNLYKLTTILVYHNKFGEQVESSYQTYIGIRDFEFDAKDGFKLNGIETKLKGVCLHEDAGSFGTAVPVSVWMRRLLKLKKMGANAIRMAHNPHSFELYTLCDLLGFLVIDEAFDEWENHKNKWWQGHNIYPPKLDGYAKDFPNWYEQDLKNMILRNKNHPSIIAWSIGNEIDYPNDPYANPLFDEMTGNNDSKKPAAERVYNPNRPDTRRLTTIAKELIKITKETDSTRPVTLAAAFPELSVETGLIDDLDVVGYNYKEFLYEKDHERFPNKPFLGSENSHGYHEWKVVRDTPYISGQFLWTGIDYLGEAHGWPIHGSGAGLMTLAGFEKSRYFLRKSWWSTDPTVYLSTFPYDENTKHPEWLPTIRKWDYAEGQTVEVRCYSNADNVMLFIGEKEVKDFAFDEQHGYYTAIVPFKEKPLKAVAKFGKDKQIDELNPHFAPAQMKANVSEMPAELVQKAEQAGLVFEHNLHQIECEILDRHKQVTLGEVMVHVEVENGKLLGIENGDLADVTAYTEHFRRTSDGRFICFVEAENSNEVKVTFKSPGLPVYEHIIRQL